MQICISKLSVCNPRSSLLLTSAKRTSPSLRMAMLLKWAPRSLYRTATTRGVSLGYGDWINLHSDWWLLKNFVTGLHIGRSDLMQQSNNGIAAVSLCHGLNGMLQLPGRNLAVMPLHLADHDGVTDEIVKVGKGFVTLFVPPVSDHIERWQGRSRLRGGSKWWHGNARTWGMHLTKCLSFSAPWTTTPLNTSELSLPKSSHMVGHGRSVTRSEPVDSRDRRATDRYVEVEVYNDFSRFQRRPLWGFQNTKESFTFASHNTEFGDNTHTTATDALNIANTLYEVRASHAC